MGQLLVGAALLAGCSAAVIWAARSLGVWLYADRPWSRLAVSVLVVMTLVAVSQQLLGAVSALRPGTLAGMVLVLSGAIVVATGGYRRSPERVALCWPLSRGWTAVLVAAATGVLVMSVADPLTTNDDALAYHYPMVANWVQSGSLVDPRGYIQAYFAWFYPSNVELLHSWIVMWGPFDLLFGPIAVATLAMSFGAVVAAIRYAGHLVGSSTLVQRAPLVAAAWITVPFVLAFSIGVGGVDNAMTAEILLAITFGLRWWVENGPSAEGRSRDRDLWVAALALGLALGSKYAAAPYAGLLAVLFVGALVWAVRRRRAPVGRCLRLLCVSAGITIIPSAFWYVRNLLVIGNPIYPSGVLGLPDGNNLAGLGEGYERIGHRLVDVIVPANGRLAVLLVALLGGLAFVVVGAVLPNLVSLWRRRDGPGRPVLFVMFGVVPAAFLGAYVLMPETGLGPASYPFGVIVTVRYGMPAFLMILLGYAVAASLRRPRTNSFILWGLVVANLLQALASQVAGFGAGNVPSRRTVAFGMIAAALVTGIFLVARWLRLEGRVRMAIGLAAGGTLVIATLARGVTNNTVEERSQVLGPYLGAIARDEILASGGPTCVTYSSSIVRTYPLYGIDFRTELLLAAKEVAPGTYQALGGVDELVELMEANDCPNLLTRDDSLDSEYAQSDALLSLYARLYELDADPTYQEAVDAMWERWMRTPEYHFASEHPEMFSLVAQEGPFRYYKLRVGAEARGSRAFPGMMGDSRPRSRG